LIARETSTGFPHSTLCASRSHQRRNGRFGRVPALHESERTHRSVGATWSAARLGCPIVPRSARVGPLQRPVGSKSSRRDAVLVDETARRRHLGFSLPSRRISFRTSGSGAGRPGGGAAWSTLLARAGGANARASLGGPGKQHPRPPAEASSSRPRATPVGCPVDQPLHLPAEDRDLVREHGGLELRLGLRALVRPEHAEDTAQQEIANRADQGAALSQIGMAKPLSSHDRVSGSHAPPGRPPFGDAGYQVTAPLEAEPTSRAYLARAPLS
jgi:hypothetical protein